MTVSGNNRSTRRSCQSRKNQLVQLSYKKSSKQTDFEIISRSSSSSNNNNDSDLESVDNGATTDSDEDFQDAEEELRKYDEDEDNEPEPDKDSLALAKKSQKNTITTDKPMSTVTVRIPKLSRNAIKICINCKAKDTYMWYNTPSNYPLFPGKLCGMCYRYNLNHPGELRKPRARATKGSKPRIRSCFNCQSESSLNWFFVPKGYPKTGGEGKDFCGNCYSYYRKHKKVRPAEWNLLKRGHNADGCKNRNKRKKKQEQHASEGKEEEDQEKCANAIKTGGFTTTNTISNDSPFIPTENGLHLNLYHETSTLPFITQEELANLIHENREDFNFLIAEFIKELIKNKRAATQEEKQEQEQEQVNTTIHISHDLQDSTFKTELASEMDISEWDTDDERHLDEISNSIASSSRPNKSNNQWKRKGVDDLNSQTVENIDSDVISDSDIDTV